MAADKPRVDRTQGPDSYATAVEISKAYYPDGPVNGWNDNNWTSYTVVLCTGQSFPDALAATPWAAQMGAPLLLTRGTSIPQVVLDEIDRLKPWRVVIVGGTGVVSQGVEAALAAKVKTVERVAGADRYETPVKIAHKYINELGFHGIAWDGGVVIARGDTFPDALAIGPAAAGMHRPIFLTRPTQFSPYVSNWLWQRQINEVIIVGGTTAVGESVKADLDKVLDAWSSPPSVRWYGSNRYSTAAQIARNGYYRRALDFDVIGIATGENFPDALGGGAADVVSEGVRTAIRSRLKYGSGTLGHPPGDVSA